MQCLVLWFSHLKNWSLISRGYSNVIKGEEDGVDLRCWQCPEAGSLCHFEMLLPASESQVKEDVPAEKDQARSLEVRRGGQWNRINAYG